MKVSDSLPGGAELVSESSMRNGVHATLSFQ